MHQYQERDGEEDIKPGGKTRVKEIESMGLKEEDVLDSKKWNNGINFHFFFIYYSHPPL